MQNIQNNRAVSSNSGKWVAFVGYWNMFCEYVSDYLAGQKHKRPAGQQKQK